jgi:hypothetical protein
MRSFVGELFEQSALERYEQRFFRRLSCVVDPFVIA